MATYSCDTSAFLDAWVRHYPPDTFPGVWEQISNLVAWGRILFIDEVVTELGRKDDGAEKWVLARRNSIVAIDGPIQDAVTDLLRDHQRMLDTRRNKSGADPFVIALAQVRQCSVLSGERSTGSLRRPKIPDVCGAIDINCVTLLDMFRAEGLQFR